MDASTVTSKGQVTIPKEIRRALGIRQGSRIGFATRNRKVELPVLHRAPESVVSGSSSDWGIVSPRPSGTPPRPPHRRRSVGIIRAEFGLR